MERRRRRPGGSHDRLRQCPPGLPALNSWARPPPWAASSGCAPPIPARRATEALEQVGLADVADKRVLAFSLGMRQRLALATALIGHPKVLILDEPANGLDPAGIQWLRGFLRYLSHEQGAAVLVSSHVLAEVEQIVDNVGCSSSRDWSTRSPRCSPSASGRRAARPAR
ncbi:ATP-binding cassette domain-containing protein [Nonomuraea guangzhouensis]|uniref:ATP-binding cassette domain-containing protein n=1 Tax=Nonomuraea guangzhouensis TaxID=1291555 RepID=A0ABW4G3D3_9ACTN